MNERPLSPAERQYLEILKEQADRDFELAMRNYRRYTRAGGCILLTLVGGFAAVAMGGGTFAFWITLAIAAGIATWAMAAEALS